MDDSTAASLDVGGLAVTTVRVNGENEEWQVDDGRLGVALPLDGGAATVVWRGGATRLLGGLRAQ